MDTFDKEIVDDKLTQADLIKLMLHNAQHMATREEVKSDILELKTEFKQDISEVKQTVSKVETSLKAEISELRQTILKIDAKFDKIQWLIVATLLTVVFKDYLIDLLK